MIIRSKPLPRRTLLRGIGATLALPMLNIMRPSESYAASPTCIGFVYVPNGWSRYGADIFPSEVGSGYSMTRILAPLEDSREDFCIISGLENKGARSDGDGPGAHARAAGTYLTSARALKRSNKARTGQSIDRYIGQRLGRAPLVMGVGGNTGRDSGYNPSTMCLSWRNANSPMQWQQPRSAFERLTNSVDFSGQQENNADAAIAARRQKSVIDYVLEDQARLNQKLGVEDRRKVEDYLAAIREIEVRIAQNALDESSMASQCSPYEYTGYSSHTKATEILFDLMIKAFECGLTQVAVVSLGREATRAKPTSGMKYGWHDCSHYNSGDKTRKRQDYERAGLWASRRAASLTRKLRRSGLLSNSLVTFGAGTGGGNDQGHGALRLPTLAIGRCNGLVTPGRHIKLPRTPIANLWATCARNAGVPVEGDRWGKGSPAGTGIISELS